MSEKESTKYEYQGPEFDPNASIEHAPGDLGDHVFVKNLHVLITNDESVWVAQGLELDYAAQGDTLDEVKMAFTDGLFLTINENLKQFGDSGIQKLLVPAPPETWLPYLSAQPNTLKAMFTDEQFHPKLPFSKIEYVEFSEAA